MRFVFRLGPSASEAAADAEFDKMTSMVKSLSNLKHLADDPGMRSVLKSLAPGLYNVLIAQGENSHNEDPEVVRAKRGLPASSKPSPASPAPETEKPTIAYKAVEPPAPRAAVTSAEGSPPDAADPKEPEPVNSSTHRAAYARMTRKMQGMDPKAFPHMSKLWAGGRKDRGGLFVSGVCFMLS